MHDIHYAKSWDWQILGEEEVEAALFLTIISLTNIRV
jgi:hypothetical protein